MNEIEKNKYKVDIAIEFEAQEHDKSIYKLEKIIDVFKNIGELHPNGIDLGYITIGSFKNPPTVGESFIIQGTKFTDYLHTSPVTKIIDQETFTTKNSTYKLIKIDSKTNAKSE